MIHVLSSMIHLGYMLAAIQVVVALAFLTLVLSLYLLFKEITKGK